MDRILLEEKFDPENVGSINLLVKVKPKLDIEAEIVELMKMA